MSFGVPLAYKSVMPAMMAVDAAPTPPDARDPIVVGASVLAVVVGLGVLYSGLIPRNGRPQSALAVGYGVAALWGGAGVMVASGRPAAIIAALSVTAAAVGAVLEIRAVRAHRKTLTPPTD